MNTATASGNLCVTGHQLFGGLGAYLARAASVAGAVMLLANSVSAYGQLGIQDTYTPSYLQFSAINYSAQRSQALATITVVRTGDFRELATVTYSTQNGTAVAGQDYGSLKGTLTIPAGVGFATFKVSILPNSAAAQSSTVQLLLSNPSPNAMITQGAATLTLLPSAPAAPTPPALAVHFDAQGQIILSWTDPNAQCVLERTDNPAGSNWSSVSVTPQVVGAQFTVAQPASGPRFFYRLRMP